MDRRPRGRHQRPQLAQERRQVLGRGLGLGDQHVEVVERGAQVHERRVRAPQGGRQQAERARQRRVLGPDGGRRLVGVADEVGEVVAALGDRGDGAARVDQEARERRLVLGHLLDELARAREDGVEVLGRLAGLVALALVLGGEALDDVGEVAAGALVERVEDLVEVDDVGGRLGGQRGALGQLLGVAGRRGERHVAVGDARQRGEPDDRRGALAQRRVGLLHRDLDRGLVVLGQLDLAHRADAAAADLHVVVLDELARVLEQQRVLGAAVASEQEQPHGERHDQREGAGRGDPRHRHRRRSLIRWQVGLGTPSPSLPQKTRANPIVALRRSEPVERSVRPERSSADSYSMPSGPCEAPLRNCRTNWLSELKRSSAGPDSTIRPRHSTAMYSATRLADMMSWVITT